MQHPHHVIRLDGYLDISRYPAFRGEFENVPPGTPVLVDITAAVGIDSIFLSELLLLRRRHDATVAVLIPAEGPVARIFAIADIGRKVAVFTDRADAAAALRA